jgi:hypothetical protein
MAPKQKCNIFSVLKYLIEILQFVEKIFDMYLQNVFEIFMGLNVLEFLVSEIKTLLITKLQ